MALYRGRGREKKFFRWSRSSPRTSCTHDFRRSFVSSSNSADQFPSIASRTTTAITIFSMLVSQQRGFMGNRHLIGMLIMYQVSNENVCVLSSSEAFFKILFVTFDCILWTLLVSVIVVIYFDTDCYKWFELTWVSDLAEAIAFGPGAGIGRGTSPISHGHQSQFTVSRVEAILPSNRRDSLDNKVGKTDDSCQHRLQTSETHCHIMNHRLESKVKGCSSWEHDVQGTVTLASWEERSEIEWTILDMMHKVQLLLHHEGDEKETQHQESCIFLIWLNRLK